MLRDRKARRLRERIRAAAERGAPDAEHELRAVLDRHPGDAHATVALAVTLWGSSPQEALELVSRSSVRESADPFVLYMAADVLANIGHIDDAVAYADESTRLANAAGRSDVLEMLVVVRARVAAMQGKLADAEELYRRFAATDQKDWLLLVPYLGFLKWQGRNAEAIALIDALPPDTKHADSLPTIRLDIAEGIEGRGGQC